jgi:hypothetical protein
MSLKKYFLLFITLLVFYPSYSSNDRDTILDNLTIALKNKQQYVALKEERILNFKKIKSDDLTKVQEYNYNKTLYKEYQKFNSDSAIFYVKKNLEIATILQDKDLLNLANLQLASLFSSTGKYRESESILKSINKKKLPKYLLPNYYVVYREFFEHYAANSDHLKYLEIIRKYRDSLLIVLDPKSLDFKINKIQQQIYNKKLDVSEKQLANLLKNIKDNTPQYAMITYLLGSISEKKTTLIINLPFRQPPI